MISPHTSRRYYHDPTKGTPTINCITTSHVYLIPCLFETILTLHTFNFNGHQSPHFYGRHYKLMVVIGDHQPFNQDRIDTQDL